MRKRSIIALCLILFLSSATIFAETYETFDSASTRTLSYTRVGMTRTSALNCTVDLYCLCYSQAESIVATVTLQKISGSTYVDYRTYSYTVTNSSSFDKSYSYTVGTSGTYRAKIYFQDTVSGHTNKVGPFYTSAVGL